METNLEYYKVFYYVAKSGSISKAAQELCISQPAVSQAVKQLEKYLGCTLFVRTSKGAVLTKEGQVLFSYVERGYEYIIMGEKKINEITNLESGEIRIGASDMTLQFYLLPYLSKFHEMYSNIKISVTNAPTPETISHLESGRIDFGVVTEPFAQADIIKKNVRQVEDVFIGGPMFEHLKSKTHTYDILSELPIICLEHNTSSRKYIDSFLSDNKVELTPEFELATSDIIVQFVMKNLGIGIVVKDFADQYIEENKLFELKFKKPIPKRNMCIITTEKVPLSNAAKKLLDLMI